MEGPQIMRPNGRIISLPPGFRFDPTDQELLVHYLKPKIFSFPLPADIIPEIDLWKFDPWDLLGTCNREQYFFNLLETKFNKGSNRSCRATSSGSGYWKVTGKDQPIMAGSRCNQPIGMKRVLTFNTGRLTRGSCRTNWIMHEYRLIETDAIHAYQKRNTISDRICEAKNWTVCRIFRKNKFARSNKETKYQLRDHGLSHDNWLNSFDSASSCVTCLSDEGEENNNCISS